MKKIKEFFDKKQNDLKFKTAGAGHKLSEGAPKAATTSSSSNASSATSSNVRRTGPDSNVANAALARFGDKAVTCSVANKPKPLHDIMAEEKKKITEELKLKDELEELKKKKSSSHEQKNPFKEFEDSQQFTCTALNIDSSLPFGELMCKIKAQIFDNFAEDPILRSAMCLFNCNRTISQDQTQLMSALEILKKIVTNLRTASPEEFEKFKRIRRSKIEQKVLSLDGALDFLFAIGFTIDSDIEWLLYDEQQNDETIKRLQYVFELLDSPQIIPIELDRKLKNITENSIPFQELDDDLKMTSSDFKQFYSNLEKTREINEMMISKEIKAKMILNTSTFKPIFAKLKFKLSLVDNEVETVEAVFYSNEKLSDVKAWVVATFSPLFDGKDVQFKVGPDLFSNDSQDKSLADLKLTPAATLIVIAK